MRKALALNDKKTVDMLLFMAFFLLLPFKNKINGENSIYKEESKMLTKVTSLGSDLYQIDDNEIPVDQNELNSILNATSKFRMDPMGLPEWYEKMDANENKSNTFEIIANKGVIVDMYEVEYPTPSDPLKETEELASNLDEHKDFVTQYLYPGSETVDVVVTLREQLEKDEKENAIQPSLNTSKPNPRIMSTWNKKIHRIFKIS